MGTQFVTFTKDFIVNGKALDKKELVNFISSLVKHNVIPESWFHNGSHTWEIFEVLRDPEYDVQEKLLDSVIVYTSYAGCCWVSSINHEV